MLVVLDTHLYRSILNEIDHAPNQWVGDDDESTSRLLSDFPIFSYSLLSTPSRQQ